MTMIAKPTTIEITDAQGKPVSWGYLISAVDDRAFGPVWALGSTDGSLKDVLVKTRDEAIERMKAVPGADPT